MVRESEQLRFLRDLSVQDFGGNRIAFGGRRRRHRSSIQVQDKENEEGHGS